MFKRKRKTQHALTCDTCGCRRPAVSMVQRLDDGKRFLACGDCRDYLITTPNYTEIGFTSLTS